MNKFKRVLVNCYNSLYDVKVHIEESRKWQEDRKNQKKYGIPKIMTVDETLDVILNTGVSVCRYGDGEFKIMDGDSIQFQKDSEKLSERLKEVIQCNDENILICIPGFIDRLHVKKIRLDDKNERIRHNQALRYTNNILAERRLKWYEYFDMSRTYGEACVSRFYASVYDDEKSIRWLKKWKQVWDGKNIIIVEGELTRMGVGNDLFNNAKSIRRILAPAKSAFSSYNQIFDAVIKHHKADELVLIALGPTATVLAYDLAKKGIRSIDIGHIDIEYEWMLRKDRTHQKIEGKFVSEAQDGNEVLLEVADERYINQVIERV